MFLFELKGAKEKPKEVMIDEKEDLNGNFEKSKKKTKSK